jgi:hypothetical protein
MSERDIEAVIGEIVSESGFDAVEARMAELAPQMQGIVEQALLAGGWFDDAHESMVLKTATLPDADERITDLRNFVLEQTRLAMLVGIAVGWEISDRIGSTD